MGAGEREKEWGWRGKSEGGLKKRGGGGGGLKKGATVIIYFEFVIRYDFASTWKRGKSVKFLVTTGEGI